MIVMYKSSLIYAISISLYYFVWLVHCDLSAHPRRSYGVIGDITALLGDTTELLSERRTTAFVLSIYWLNSRVCFLKYYNINKYIITLHM